MWEGGISIAEGVNRKADRNVPRREGGFVLGCMVFPRAGQAAPRPLPGAERTRADCGLGGTRWRERGASWGRGSPLPSPQCDWELALGLCWSQAAAGSARLLLGILVPPPSLRNYCRERAPCPPFKHYEFFQKKRKRRLILTFE